jgi:hypothetical protein
LLHPAHAVARDFWVKIEAVICPSLLTLTADRALSACRRMPAPLL